MDTDLQTALRLSLLKIDKDGFSEEETSKAMRGSLKFASDFNSTFPDQETIRANYNEFVRLKGKNITESEQQADHDIQAVIDLAMRSIMLSAEQVANDTSKVMVTSTDGTHHLGWVWANESGSHITFTVPVESKPFYVVDKVRFHVTSICPAQTFSAFVKEEIPDDVEEEDYVEEQVGSGWGMDEEVTATDDSTGETVTASEDVEETITAGDEVEERFAFALRLFAGEFTGK